MKKILIFLVTLFILGCLFVGAYLYFWTPENMAMWGKAKLDGGYYDAAAQRYEEAVKLDPTNHDYVMSLLDVYMKLGNYTKAERCLIQAIREKPDTKLYCKLSELYVAQNKILDSQLMLDTITDESVRREVEALRPALPLFSHAGGSYDSYIEISLRSTEGSIYYSLDGEYPSSHSEAYSTPIPLQAGTTRIRAIVVSENGLTSPIAEEQYHIVGVVEELEFQSPELEEMIREQLYIARTEKIQSSDLWEITALKLPEEVTVLEDLHYFTSLKELDAQGCSIEDYSPLVHLVGLESLNLNGNLVSTDSLAVIGQLTTLKRLYLSGCGISNISSLAGLTAMEDLDLSDNSIKDLSGLKDMDSLISLNLRSNAIPTLEPLTGLATLQEFHIGYNSITSLSPLQLCNNMKILHAENNNLLSVGALGHMFDLSILNVSHNELEDVSALSNCTRMTELYADNNFLTAIDCISKMPLLKVLDCNHNRILTLPQMDPASVLQKVDASYNQLVTVAPLAGLKELSVVNVDYNEGVEDIEILSGCNVLVQVNAFGTHVIEVKKLTDMGVVVNYDPSYEDKQND